MKRSLGLISLAGLGLLSACSEKITQIPTGNPAVQLDPAPGPFGEIRILPGSKKPVLRFEIHYAATGFRTQAVDCARFDRFQISVTGVGIPTALYPAAAVPAQNNTIPAAGCTITANINNVPSGESRIAKIVPYDTGGQPIPGLSLSAVFDITATPTTVELSYRSTPAGQIVNQLLTTLNNPLLATHLDRVALQTLVDTMTQAQGTFPNYTYVTHPSLVDTADILQALTANNGQVNLLSAANPAFLLTPGSLSGNITGLVSSDKVSIRVMDPVSGALVNQGNGNFTINNIPPGTWKLDLTLPPGYTSNAPATVTVTEGGTVNLGIALTPARPVVTSLGAATGSPGDTLVINGSQFHPNADGNTVVIGGVTVPAANITVISSTQLNVKVPTGFLGDTSVAVSVGSQAAVAQPAFKIVPGVPLSLNTSALTSTSFTLNWNAVPGADSYKIYRNGVFDSTVTSNSQNFSGLTATTNYPMQVSSVTGGVESALSPVLNVFTPANWTGWELVGLGLENIQALAVPTNNSNVVWAGSLFGGGSVGGVWKCTSAGGTDTCVSKLPGTSTGSVISLAISPQDSNLLLAGTVNRGIFRSTDGGGNWTQIDAVAGLTNFNIRSIVFDPRNPNMVYAGTLGNGVFVSANGGQTFSNVITGLANLNVGSLAIYNPPLPAPTVIYAGTFGAGVHRATTDTVATTGWSTINNGLSFASGFFLSSVDVRALTTHPTNPARLFGGGTGGCSVVFICQPPGGPVGGFQVGVWRHDDPTDWVQIGRDATHGYPLGSPGSGLSNMNILALAVDPILTENVYAATQGGIFRSLNGGTAWSSMATGLPSPTISVNTIAINPLRLYIGTTAGVFRAN